VIRIAVTDPLRTEAERDRYIDWLTRSEPDLVVSVLAPERSVPADLAGYHGLLLSGGGDVDPGEYGRAEERVLASGVRRERDRLERGLIEEAIRRGIPLLGICRGMQMVNVALGGTLILDLDAAGYPGHRTEPGSVRRHRIHLEGTSRLAAKTGVDEGVIVSSHHQSVDRPADGLRIVARSEDGVIEALEWHDASRRPRVLLVQWHPERMAEEEGALTTAVRDLFVQATREYAEHDEVAPFQRTHTQSEGEQ